MIAFDAKNDLAVLRVPGLEGRPLVLAEPERGVAVALVGYPGNGPSVEDPWAARRDEPVREPRCLRAGAREPDRDGDSREPCGPGSRAGRGSTPSGRVRTTVFARRPAGRGGYGIPAELVRKVLAEAEGTGPPLATDCAKT